MDLAAHGLYSSGSNGRTIESAGGSGVKIGTVECARVRAYEHVPVNG